jgi:hypothetical protein
MLFVALGKQRAGTTKERVVRRMQWDYPPGGAPVAEYWLQSSDPVVVVVMEAADIAPIMAATSQWDDVFEWRVFPAVTAQQGMEIAKKLM